jgi:hypothetical protein
VASAVWLSLTSCSSCSTCLCSWLLGISVTIADVLCFANTAFWSHTRVPTLTECRTVVWQVVHTRHKIRVGGASLSKVPTLSLCINFTTVLLVLGLLALTQFSLQDVLGNFKVENLMRHLYI